MATESKVFRLTDPGEGLTEAEIVRWHVAVGDVVAVNQPLVDVETAKAVVELPSPWAGTVTELLVPAGDVADVGTPIIRIDVESNADAAAEASEPVLVGYGPGHLASKGRGRRRAGGHGVQSVPAVPVQSGPVLAKPPVRRLARDLGVDLRRVAPTGVGGTVSRIDVEREANAQRISAHQASSGAGSLAPLARDPRDEVIQVRGVMRTMAQAMSLSAFTIPHVTEWVEVDVTESVALARELNASINDLRVGPMQVACAALLDAVRTYPRINASWDEASSELLVHPFVNLGIAVATDRGLIVPNVKDADALDFEGMTRGIAEVVRRTRGAEAKQHDLSGGTITVTNVGVFGVDGGTPIIPPGQGAILCLGAVRAKPWVVDGQVQVRDICQLTLSFDHRFVDGELGSRVLAHIAGLLEQPKREALRVS